jgi:hypothetical protein
MNFIYSKAFMIKSQSLETAKICPNEISCLKIEIENINLPTELRIDQQYQHQHQGQRRNKHDKTTARWERYPPPKPITIFNVLPPDIKRITGILNKISDENFDKLIEEAKTFNYADEEVVSVIFKKIMSEPFFSDIYAKFCNSLQDLHEIINKRCIIEFNKTKHKNLGKFIGELYKLNLLDDLDSFLNSLTDDINEAKLETLCKIITTIGVKNEIFIDIIINLDLIKTKFGSRHKFMILDIVEGKNSKISLT